MALCAGAVVHEGKTPWYGFLGVGLSGSHTYLKYKENRGKLEIEYDMSHMKMISSSNVYLFSLKFQVF